ncbi:D-arabinono-1,4-lactone oxidase, partial [Modicella reniformis]
MISTVIAAASSTTLAPITLVSQLQDTNQPTMITLGENGSETLNMENIVTTAAITTATTTTTTTTIITTSDIIQLAKLSGKCGKAIGTHSPSDLACTDGFMINTDKLNNLISVDSHNKTITIQAGMKLNKVHKILEKHEMVMCNLGSDQSVAGVMTTATHGTGVDYSTMCASVLDLTLITANGDLLYCSRAENPDIFNAAA